ncbi:50S ribosomal protein L11 methyltransferase [Shinella sp. PSBB067]|uniref:50S ribosomal protein L11 methyltransferase n=1 Tax=Shinella sp. PSBB067 TaxID=2715959 RepID=UPI0009296ADA|nr:50S ribosomal protein L11 methyltransferase [Shinella sp. PSBB067]MBN9053060.1 50S ribosomal protein L11 methyltransferase [Hyphomicrobiales bacterium]OJU98274.1 MAG: ribosomal protein L11 methyltransferase [Shinella sp. 65-6]QRI65456.1 50S ribosomal protein L11 methyltransferase [Shinella sp. PSBB067]
MSEIRLYITTTERRAEAALSLMTDAFEEEGYAIATMEIDEKNDVWEASVYMFRPEEPEIHERFAALLAADFPGVEIQREVLPDIDWIARSLEGLKPVRAGRFVVHGSHDRGTARAGEIAVEIDAGQAFGTGHHGTTAGCLEVIFDVMRKRRVKRALDLGTGSGVLAIAARKLAPIRVLATDIDPVAIRVARENVRLNGIASGIALETAPGFHSTAFGRHGPFDLVIANILARPLMRMAPQLAARLAPNGDVILSGILASQRWKVLAAYNGAGLRHVKTIWREGWVTIHLDNRR